MTIVQQKTGRPVPFDLTEPTREALAAWLTKRGLRSGDWLFPSRSHLGDHVTTRQYSRLVDDWVALAGLDPAAYGTSSLRRTKVALYKWTGNLRACQLLLGHTKLESTVRYLGIESMMPSYYPSKPTFDKDCGGLAPPRLADLNGKPKLTCCLKADIRQCAQVGRPCAMITSPEADIWRLAFVRLRLADRKI